MKKLILVFCLSAFLFASIEGTNGSTTTTTTKKAVDCLSYAANQTFQNDAEEQSYTLERFNKIVKVGLFKTPTPLLKKLEAILTKMANSNSLFLNRITVQYASRATLFFTNVRELYPSFCPMAKLINQTVEWRKSDDPSKYLQSLDSFSTTLLYTHKLMAYSIQKQQGCKDVQAPRAPSRDCWENGLVSKLDCLLDYYGELLPWPLYAIINKLAASALFEEKAAATLFGYILIPQRNLTLSRIDNKILSEILNLHIASRLNQLPICCCGFYKNRTAELAEYLDNNAYEAIEGEREKINNQCS